MTSDENRSPLSRDGMDERIILIQNLEAGARVRLANGATAEVVANPRDGVWVLLRYLSFAADPSRVGTEELVFAREVREELPSA
jgi:hypothetical protein